jgi:hypothetical protein
LSGKTSPLNAGSRSLARNPADIYQAKEQKTCKGCAYVESLSVAGISVQICGLGRGYGRRCKRYAERAPAK